MIDSWITKEPESYFFENLLDNLSIEQKSLCDAEISLIECKEAVMSLKDNRLVDYQILQALLRSY